MNIAAELTEARASLARHEADYTRLQRHSADLRVYHAEKPRPPEGSRPKAPEGERPTADQLREAAGLTGQALRAEGAAAAADRAVVDARKQLQTALEIQRKAGDEAERVSKRLLPACRRAPADEAAKSLAAMGDVGALTIEFAGEDRGKTDPYVRVLWGGVPFDLLSGGQRVLADLLLRLGLRRAAGRSALPIVVDDVQALNGGDGPWPEVEGASIWLRTSGGAS